VPGPGFSGRALAAARAGVRPRRGFRGLRFSAQLALVLIALTVFAALVIGGRLFRLHPPQGQTISHGSPKATSQYQLLVGREWPAIRAASNAPVCRATLHVNAYGNPTRGMPTDVANCRAGVLETGRLAQKLLNDLDGVAVPDNLREPDVTLRSGLAAMQTNAVPAADALDQGLSDVVWSHVDAQLGAYTAAYPAVLLIARG
jgi:hypothetical protein